MSRTIKSFNIKEQCVLQDYTAVGAVGSASQQFAGRNYTKAELDDYFSTAMKAYYKFVSGALTTDEYGSYNLSLGAAAKEPSNSTGIMGTNYAMSFDGGDYAVQSTLFDNTSTTFSSGIMISLWVSLPSDGQPASQQTIFYAGNVGDNAITLSVVQGGGPVNDTKGQFLLSIMEPDSDDFYIYSRTILPDGANTQWVHIVANWDSTNGLRLWVNGILEAENVSLTSVMTLVDTDIYLGGTDTTPTLPLTGKIANLMFINKIATQEDVDFLYGVNINKPNGIQSIDDVIFVGYMKVLGSSTNIKQFYPRIIQSRSNDIILKGGGFATTDERRIIGRM